MMEAVVAWLVAAQFAWQPAPATQREHYEAIAQDIATIAYDPDEAPLFRGPRGRARTALLLDAVASLESQYRADIDDGRKRGSLGEVCVLQVLLPSPRHRVVLKGDTYAYSLDEGWSYADLIDDRQKCIRVALRKMRESLRACHDLSLYTCGRCDEKEMLAKHRLGRAEGMWRHAPFETIDEEILIHRPSSL